MCPGVKSRVMGKNEKQETFTHSELCLRQQSFDGLLWLGREVDLRYLAEGNISCSIGCEIRF